MQDSLRRGEGMGQGRHLRRAGPAAGCGMHQDILCAGSHIRSPCPPPSCAVVQLLCAVIHGVLRASCGTCLQHQPPCARLSPPPGRPSASTCTWQSSACCLESMLPDMSATPPTLVRTLPPPRCRPSAATCTWQSSGCLSRASCATACPLNSRQQW